ncbi:neuropeptide CCHamide-1 isoform X1 [Ostrinia nubilalis]|uniref:neuropeptide CCHamide-1 isoform X1 n=1 Tax=Ostrinia nubilalis TaxID=29057 RepID=UPI003082612C
MDKSWVSKRSSAATTLLALMLIVCLVESATEQRINSRGSKSSNLIEKVNGWRSQRGGSCLSYGHSCWGAHGKRSGRPPVTAPDWYLTTMLRRMASNAELNRVRQASNNNEDLNAIFQVEVPNDTSNEKVTSDNEEMPMETGPKTLEAKPMLDDDLISKIKLWQIMREASEDK